MSTPNLAISHIASSQNTREVTANTAFDELDTSMTDYYAISVTGGSDVTPSSGVVINEAFLDCTGALTAAINLILPVTKRFYVVRHSATGGHAITVKTSAAGTNGSVVLLPGDCRLVYDDGTNIIAINAAAPTLAQAVSATVSLAIVPGRQVAIADATSAAFTVTLPDATKCNGSTVVVKKKDSGANLVTVEGASSQDIDGANTYTGLSAQYKFLEVTSDGTQWWIVGSN